MISRVKGWINTKILRYLDYAVTKRAAIHTCNVKGMVILLDVESEIEAFRASTYATKEPETLEWIQRYFRRGDVIYDIGANIGQYSLFAAKYLQSQCRVYAFEPEALNYAKLNKNVYINGFSGVVIPCCLAVTDTLCFDTFHLHPNVYDPERIGEGLISGSALHGFGTPVDHLGNEYQSIHQQGMVGVPLDHLWQTFGMEFPNHIKIDVDGLEERIVEGAEKTLADPRLKSVLVEISAERGARDPIVQRLSKAGFSQVTDFEEHSSEQLKGTPYQDSVNTVFIRE